MAIFSISDIVISVTLIINALALMSSQIRQLSTKYRVERGLIPMERPSMDESSKENSAYSSQHTDGMHGTATDTQSLLNENDVIVNANDDGSLENRLVALVMGVRSLSTIIIMWNCLFFILMIGVFGS